MKDKLEKILAQLDDCAMVVRPASDEDIKECQEDLINNDLPFMPQDYTDFLKVCNGLAFNGMEIFGTDIVTNEEHYYQLIDIVSFNEDRQVEDLLVFGRIDDDLYCYNSKTKKYEVRDLSSMDVWDEYVDFEDFFNCEMMKWLSPEEFDEDDGRFDAYV